MTNFQVYRKVLSFSLLGFLVDMLALAVVAGTSVGGFLIMNQTTDRALIGLGIGFIIGIILAVLISIFISNRIKAAQIAMMVKGVTEGQLPEHTFKEGFNEIRGRFGKITVFFFITNAIKSIFRQIGRGINKVGTAIGGQAGDTVTSVIDSAIQTLIGYLCDCCLGWVLYRKDINPFKAGCEGTVIFFKHGKTLIRNVGRIFGMGLLSLLLIGGSVFGLSYLIFSNMPQVFNTLSAEITEAFVRAGETAPEFIADIMLLTLFVCAILAIVVWSCLHSVLIRPFILVGVMRNYMEAGKEHMPSEQEFAEMQGRFPRFSKLYDKI